MEFTFNFYFYFIANVFNFFVLIYLLLKNANYNKF